jgi:hypothetical protein
MCDFVVNILAIKQELGLKRSDFFFATLFLLILIFATDH